MKTKLATAKQEKDWWELTKPEGRPRAVGSLSKNREWDRDLFGLAADYITDAGPAVHSRQTQLSGQRDLDQREEVAGKMEYLDDAIAEIDPNKDALAIALLGIIGRLAEGQ